MKVIVAGSRDIIDRAEIVKAIKGAPFPISELVSGTARGVDTIAENFAVTNNIPVKLFPADWRKYGKPAGMIRNKQMADYADALIAVWDGRSRGTRNMIETMNKEGKPVCLYLIKDKKEENDVGI